MAKLFVRRIKDDVDLLVPYSIYLNDSRIGSIKSNAVFEKELGAGEFSLLLKSGFLGSNRLNFSLSEDQTIRLVVKRNSLLIALQALLTIVPLLFFFFSKKSGDYLYGCIGALLGLSLLAGMLFRKKYLKITQAQA